VSRSGFHFFFSFPGESEGGEYGGESEEIGNSRIERELMRRAGVADDLFFVFIPVSLVILSNSTVDIQIRPGNRHSNRRCD
jgi:hypothetical protein